MLKLEQFTNPLDGKLLNKITSDAGLKIKELENGNVYESVVTLKPITAFIEVED